MDETTIQNLRFLVGGTGLFAIFGGSFCIFILVRGLINGIRADNKYRAWKAEQPDFGFCGYPKFVDDGQDRPNPPGCVLVIPALTPFAIVAMGIFLLWLVLTP